MSDIDNIQLSLNSFIAKRCPEILYKTNLSYTIGGTMKLLSDDDILNFVLQMIDEKSL